MSKVVGILGGMGPMSTVDLMRKVTEKTPVRIEQEHLRLLVDSRPQIPDRTAAVFGEGPSPAPILRESARLLEGWGADLIAIPCNSAHAFLDQVRDAVGIEVLDMPGIVGREIAARFPAGAPIGLLGTSGSYRAGLYHKRLPDHRVVTPAVDVQDELVMGAIYQVKVEDKVQEPRAKLLEAASTLEPSPVALIAGCTEVELAFEGAEGPVPIFMPMDLLAEEIVRVAWREETTS
jgi:aspartate racemase